MTTLHALTVLQLGMPVVIDLTWRSPLSLDQRYFERECELFSVEHILEPAGGKEVSVRSPGALERPGLGSRCWAGSDGPRGVEIMTPVMG